ncbi:uncharacterized protein LOC135834692 [Planococcus citri]|uniref:uncharacterized protein LOC135834692 n=1 Tax=Planococcus citri TaxID=170843 RepID=UPI0031F72891
MTKKLVCGVFSYKIVSIALLSYPVLSIIGSLLSKFTKAEDSFEVQTIDIMVAFHFLYICISGLIGIQKKKPSLLKPVLWTILFFIVAVLALCIHYIVVEFDFKSGRFSSRDVSIEFQEVLMAELELLYIGHIISSYYWDLLGEYQLPIMDLDIFV